MEDYEEYEDDDEIPAASKKLIEKIRRLYHKHYSRRKGVVINSWEEWNVGIRCQNYMILVPEGVCWAYWTSDQDVPKRESAIVAAVLDSDSNSESEFEAWEEISEEDLEEYLELLEEKIGESSRGGS